MHRATVLLPAPDSPTMPSASPARISKLTSVAASTGSRDFPSHERRAWIFDRPSARTTTDVSTGARRGGSSDGTEAISIFV